MYRVDKQNKTLIELEEIQFKDAGITERQDIQQWIISNPSVLGEELLIIQEEFDEFENTNERLDLLALDKQGNLVIIENKRDDSGKDVTWQAIKYASYCSTLTTQDVIDLYQQFLSKKQNNDNAEELINQYFEDSDMIYPSDKQRIMLVAHSFRREVLSAAQWLSMNHVDISCIEIKPYKDGSNILLDSNILFPQAANKEFTLKLERKNIDNQTQKKLASGKKAANSQFWSYFSKGFDAKGTPFENITSWSTNKESWIGAPSKFGSGIRYSLVVNSKESRVELYIDTGDKAQNKETYDDFYNKKNEIEQCLAGYNVIWQRSDNARVSKIAISKEFVFTFDQSPVWDDISTFLKDGLSALKNALES